MLSCYHEHKRLMPHLYSELISPRDMSLCIETESESSEGQDGSEGTDSWASFACFAWSMSNWDWMVCIKTFCDIFILLYGHAGNPLGALPASYLFMLSRPYWFRSCLAGMQGLLRLIALLTPVDPHCSQSNTPPYSTTWCVGCVCACYLLHMTYTFLQSGTQSL